MKTLDEMLFARVLKCARDLSVGDTLDISPHPMVIVHVETKASGRVVLGYFHTGRTFRYTADRSVAVLEMK